MFVGYLCGQIYAQLLYNHALDSLADWLRVGAVFALAEEELLLGEALRRLVLKLLALAGLPRRFATRERLGGIRMSAFFLPPTSGEGDLERERDLEVLRARPRGELERELGRERPRELFVTNIESTMAFLFFPDAPNFFRSALDVFMRL